MRLVCVAVVAMMTVASAVWGAQADDRLARKVTYDGGYKRLHEVASDLSRLTKVQVSAGSGSSDWQVRDRPVTVCAKGVRLDVLLRSLALACHLDLTASTVREEKTYRISLTEAKSRELQAVIDRERSAAVASAECVWNSYIEAANQPESAFKADSEQVAFARMLGQLLGNLGPEAKRKVLAGEPVMVTEKWQELVSGMLSNHPEAALDPGMPADKLMRSSLTVWFSENDPGSVPGLRTRIIWEDGTPHRDIGHITGVGPSWYSDPSVVMPPPSWPEPSKDELPAGLTWLSDEPDYARFRSIVFREAAEKPADAPGPKWRLPLLEKRVKLDLPEKESQFAAMLAALSKAGGVSIICEDFASKMSIEKTVRYGQSVEDLYKVLRSETTLGEKLMVLWRYYEIEWIIDSGHSVIIGRPIFYIPRHENMLPQAFLEDLKKKGAGAGLDLEDILAVEQCTKGQVEEWIRENSDLSYMPAQSFSGVYGLVPALRKLYAQLSAGDQRQAKSESGLPLSKLDADWLSKFFASQGPLGESLYQRHVYRDDDFAGVFKTLADPASYAKLTLFLKKAAVSVGKSDIPRHTYTISLEGEAVTPKCESQMDGFPIYSPEREDALRKERKDTDKPTK